MLYFNMIFMKGDHNGLEYCYCCEVMKCYAIHVMNNENWTTCDMVLTAALAMNHKSALLA